MTVVIGRGRPHCQSEGMLKIGFGRDHGFDEPLGLLSDCHRRIEYFLAVLAAIADRAGGRELDAAERRQLDGALTYFKSAAPRHTADEEESLFPRLEASRDASAAATLEIIQRLEHDHAEADSIHEAVDRLGRAWLAGSLPPGDIQELQRLLERLRCLYEAHISVEDRQLFPAAARILSVQELRAIGSEMARRRLMDFKVTSTPSPS
jgi:hemerythrin-like domain-containing protein